MNLPLKAQVRALIGPPSRVLARSGVTANHLTFLGLALSLLAGFALAAGRYLPAALLMTVSGVCDMLDGAVARAGGGESRLGAFLDSTLDRIGESAIYVGSAWRVAALAGAAGGAGAPWALAASAAPALALATSLLVSYARARAEGLGAECRVGLMERTERMVLLILGAGIAIRREDAWSAALLLLAALNLITLAQRVLHVARALKRSS